MRRRIRKDHQRFKRIVEGKVRENLKDLITGKHLTGKKGSRTVKVPLKEIDIPRFSYDPRSAGGVGAGEGKKGEVVEDGRGGPKTGPGDRPGAHFPEVEIDLKRLAEIMGEKLKLPDIEPKGEELTVREGEAFRDVSRSGPETLLRKKRSLKRGLIRKALLHSGEKVDPAAPVPVPPRPEAETVPVKEDKRYLYPGEKKEREARAVVIFMRDISGSMTGEKTDIIRQMNFLIDVWLKSSYHKLDKVYLVHDFQASQVGEEKFYQLSAGGGTRISSVYKLCLKKIRKEYPPDTWNIYPFHFSDGENTSRDTEKVCIPLLSEEIIPHVNRFCYGQVSPGSPSPGKHLEELEVAFGDREGVASSLLSERDQILDSIRDFFGD